MILGNKAGLCFLRESWSELSSTSYEFQQNQVC